jgi:hypothetical protein
MGGQVSKLLSLDELFKGRHFDAEIIVLCVRWYLGFKLSYRDLAAMMAERGVFLAPSTILRWVQRYAPEFEKRCGVVAHQPAREADQNRCQGRQSRPLRHVSDGGGRDPAQAVRCDHAENRCLSSAAAGNGKMNTTANRVGRKTTAKVRPDDHAARLFGARRPDAGSASCRTDRPGLPRAGKLRVLNGEWRGTLEHWNPGMEAVA